MDSTAILVAMIASLPGFVMGGWSLLAAKGKTKAETNKTNAETENIHAQIADRWAEHVTELQEEVKNLHLDIAQVRRENERYRQELRERDQIIANLKDWSVRLIKQLAVHAPDVEPEPYRHVVGDDTLRRLRQRRVEDKNDGNKVHGSSQNS